MLKSFVLFFYNAYMSKVSSVIEYCKRVDCALLFTVSYFYIKQGTEKNYFKLQK